MASSRVLRMTCSSSGLSVHRQWFVFQYITSGVSVKFVRSVAMRFKGNKLDMHEISNSQAYQGTFSLRGRCKELWMKKRVAVVFGSRSVEHEVSIITAVQAMNSLDEEQFEVVPLYVSKEGAWFTGEALKTMDVFRDLVSLPGKAQRVQLQPFAGKSTFVVQAPRRGFMGRGIDVEPLAVDVALLCNHGTNGCLLYTSDAAD